jgi:hypothetical protein
VDNLPTWVPDACTLPSSEQPLRVAAFDSLFTTSLRAVYRIGPDALRLSFDPEAEATLVDLVARESECCSFFAFRLSRDDDALHLDTRVPQVHVAILDALAARAADLAESTGSH